MQRNVFSRPAPYGCTAIVEVATGKRAAHRLRHRTDFENEHALHVWRDLGTWYGVIEHGTAELVCGRQEAIGLAKRFAHQFNVHDVIDEWIAKGARSDIAVKVSILAEQV